jgi:hypothetical protein
MLKLEYSDIFSVFTFISNHVLCFYQLINRLCVYNYADKCVSIISILNQPSLSPILIYYY